MAIRPLQSPVPQDQNDFDGFYKADAANQSFDSVPSRSGLDELRAKISAMPYNNPRFWTRDR